MRIVHTLAWGLVCFGAVAAGGFLASNLADSRSESWSAAGRASVSQGLSPAPRTQFLAQPEQLELATAEPKAPTLSLFPAPAASGAEQTLVHANFNEDDVLGAPPQLVVPARLSDRHESVPGLNNRAPILSVPRFAATPSALGGAVFGDALAEAGALTIIPRAEVDANRRAPESMRGLQAEGRSLSLSLFGAKQTTNSASNLRPALAPAQVSKGGAGDAKLPAPTILNQSGASPAGDKRSDSAGAKQDVKSQDRPSAALIDPELQVASLDQNVGLRPSFEADKRTSSSVSFPRLDISVALYHMDEALPQTQRADRILVEKGARLLHLFNGEQLVKSYRIDLGFSPVGHKLAEGDGKTPEGDYRIDWRKKDSEFYRALHISYPSEQDASIAKFSGRDPGGAIMIHGRPNGFGDNDPLAADWTAGCIAVKNAAVEEIWAAIDDGAPIRIRP